MHVRWDESAPTTAHGHLVFFAEFLVATDVFERWVSSCPLEYRSGNAPDKRDMLGTLMLGLLAGHRRYAHITALRGDVLAAQTLGMNKVVSQDALRRALERIDEAGTTATVDQPPAPSPRDDTKIARNPRRGGGHCICYAAVSTQIFHNTGGNHAGCPWASGNHLILTIYSGGVKYAD
jgi:hypothetical protein